MHDLNRLSTPVLQDWWERYVCPACMSQARESWGLCADDWHTVPAVTFECSRSAFSPISIPVGELQREGLEREATVARYGRVWTRSATVSKRRGTLEYV
jgi:hypothetical protein